MALPKGPFYRQLGDQIRRLRTGANMSQAGLAHAVTLSRTSITNIEKGRQPVQVHVLLKIAQALGVGAAALLDPFEVGTNVEFAAIRGVKLDMKKLDWVKRVLKGDGE